jgi:hypothetical protein
MMLQGRKARFCGRELLNLQRLSVVRPVARQGFDFGVLKDFLRKDELSQSAALLSRS